MCHCAPKKGSPVLPCQNISSMNDLQEHEVMSPECWVEPCSESQAEETGLENQQGEEAEKEEVEVPCGDNQPAGNLRQEEAGGERPLSCDHSGIQEVTSEGGLEQVQREEMLTQEKRERLSHMTVNHERGGSGVWREKWDIKCDVICCSFHNTIQKYSTAYLML